MREGLGCCWQRRKLVFCDLKAFEEAAAVLQVVLVISWNESCDSACLTGLSAVPVVVTAHLGVGRFVERPGSGLVEKQHRRPVVQYPPASLPLPAP